MNAVKKVLHISSYYPPNIGGIQQVAEDIVNSLDGEFEQTVICFHDKKKTEIDIQGNVKIIRAATKFKIASQSISFCFKKLLKDYMKAEKPDIIHFHYPNPWAAGALLKCKFDAKLIVHWHSDIVKQKFLKKFFKGQTIKLLKRADTIVATSPLYIDKSEFLPQFKDKVKVIPNCINELALNPHQVNEEAVKKIKEQYPEKIVCLFVGRLVPYKGLEYLLRGLPDISENVQILIGGSGPLDRQLKEIAGQDKRVEFLGAIPRQSLKEYFSACDVFVFPSITKNEAFGIALAEAMYFGKPAVTYTIDGSGVNYVSIDGETGIECENRNLKQFADAINRLAGNQELREKLGESAKKRVEELFLFSAFQENIRRLYSGLC